MNETAFQRLVGKTHQAWKGRALAHLSADFESAAVSRSLEEFRLLFEPNLRLISFAFSHSEPAEDEFLIEGLDEPGWLGVVITNKCFYFCNISHVGDEFDKFVKVAAEDLADCRVNHGWLSNSTTVVRKSGWMKKTRFENRMVPPNVLDLIMQIINA